MDLCFTAFPVVKRSRATDGRIIATSQILIFYLIPRDLFNRWSILHDKQVNLHDG